MLLFNFVNCVFLLLCLFLLFFIFCSVYSVSLCCSVYYLCVNVYCTAATECQPNCSEKYISTSIESIVVDIRCESVDWIHMTQGRVQRSCLVNTIVALMVP